MHYTQRHAQVSVMRSRGGSIRCIADSLGISKAAVRRIYADLDAEKRGSAAETTTNCSAPSCRGCGQAIVIEPVSSSEDGTVPWAVTVPRGHSVTSILPELVYFTCPTGDRYAIQTPKSVPNDLDPDNETILERLEQHIETQRTQREPSNPDPVRELEWWEKQYQSKLDDLTAGPERQRPLPTPEELQYFEDKILELGGSSNYVKEMAWLARQNRLVQDMCPKVEAPAPTPKLARAQDPVLGPLWQAVRSTAALLVLFSTIIGSGVFASMALDWLFHWIF